MNPEFQRNLYLEFSFARLIGMPLCLAVIFALTYLMNEQQFDENTAHIAEGLYIFIVLFWGSRQAAESIFDELRNRTWDIQKTSAISAWSLTWGKLFGSTLFNWYGGVICLLVYALTTPKTELVFIVMLYGIGCGVLAQALSLLVSLFALRKKQLFNPSVSYLFVLFLFFFVWGTTLGLENKGVDTVHWYAFQVEESVFGLTSLALACGWSIVGIYRLLAQELQIRTLPWVWLLFVAFLVIYTQGFVVGYADPISHEKPLAAPDYIMLIAFGVCTSLTYGLILIDSNNPMQMRKLWIYSQEEKWLRFFEEIPCWLISLVLAAPACIYLTLFVSTEKAEDLHFYPIPIFLLMLRDIAIVLFFNYAPNPKRALGLSVLYLTFLYWIIPAIFMETGANTVAALFLPLVTDNIGLAIIFASVQVAIMGYLLFQRWQNTLNQFQNRAET